jgi:hypothetical protein
MISRSVSTVVPAPGMPKTKKQNMIPASGNFLDIVGLLFK